MIIRGTPKDIEQYIKVYDKDKIVRLAQKGFNPSYIDDTFAYFEYSKELINAIIEIVQLIDDMDNKGV